MTDLMQNEMLEEIGDPKLYGKEKFTKAYHS